MKLETIYIIVGKKIHPAEGHKRGNMLMVPSPHGPLYFQKPRWHDSLTEVESFIKGKK